MNSSLRTLKLTIAYDGTDYHGWQVQPNAITVQARIEEAVFKFSGESNHLNGSGRTDAGVHAWGQTASMAYNGKLSVARIQAACNSLLPEDISIRQVKDEAQNFHARKSAIAKTYLYVIDNGSVANPFLRRYAWHIRQPLNLPAMAQAADFLVGCHDFLSFKAADGKTATSQRTILQTRWLKRGSYLLFFIKGDGFLKNMVRIIAGTLVECGRGRYSPSAMAEIISARERTAAGITAPARGLILRSVDY